jgi:hypothetical protein
METVGSSGKLILPFYTASLPGSKYSLYFQLSELIYEYLLVKKFEIVKRNFCLRIVPTDGSWAS